MTVCAGWGVGDDSWCEGEGEGALLPGVARLAGLKSRGGHQVGPHNGFAVKVFRPIVGARLRVPFHLRQTSTPFDLLGPRRSWPKLDPQFPCFTTGIPSEMDDEPIIPVDDDPPAVQRRGPKLGGRARPPPKPRRPPGRLKPGLDFPVHTWPAKTIVCTLPPCPLPLSKTREMEEQAISFSDAHPHRSRYSSQ